jgi:hypothetical protein
MIDVEMLNLTSVSVSDSFLYRVATQAAFQRTKRCSCTLQDTSTQQKRSFKVLTIPLRRTNY